MKNTLQIFATLCMTSRMMFAAEPDPAKFNALRAEVEALASLPNVPRFEVVQRGDATSNHMPILYAGLDYTGRPTKVFAWLGLPEERKAKVPAVVLVHGGGGTASKVC